MRPEWHHLDVSGPRLGNGVKVRADGAGDGFARAHRDLGRGFHMHDIDAVFGMEVFGANTGDRLFVEYEPDHYENRLNLVRKFAVIAMFDRKKSIELARSSFSSLSTAFYLHMCRALGREQPRTPRFFYCCGEGTGPWRLLEVDAESGSEGVLSAPFESKDIRRVWVEVGLAELRDGLRSWVIGRRQTVAAK